MKTSLIAFLLFLLLLFIVGCSEAEPAEPLPEVRPTATPVRTPIPEPECSHFWKNSDCFNPYICYDCDETKGSPLDHFWLDANYQEASRCVNCGEINGEPLEPNFTARGLRTNTTAGRSYRFKTITNANPPEDAIGLATLMYIDMFESDFDHPEKRGYEYIVGRFMLTFSNEEAGPTGFRYMTGQLDFYGFDPDEAAVAHDDLPESDIPGFMVVNRKLNFFGKEYEYYVKYALIQSEQIGNMWYVVFEHTFLVPAGYDGIVVYVSNAGNWSSANNRVLSDNFDRETLFFRLRAQTN